MTDSGDDTRAELLCYLVVAQFVAMARTGEWLRTDHLVESGRIWCKANGARFDWQERISLGQIAAELAPEVMETFGLTRERSLVPLFVEAGWCRKNHGPGISVDERKRVFDPFHRMPGNGQVPTGLGLSIVQIIAKCIGARRTRRHHCAQLAGVDHLHVVS
jgi:hypothetical protein